MKILYLLIPIFIVLFLTLEIKIESVSVDKDYIPEISINIPNTKYSKLNNLVQNKIDEIKNVFKEEVQNNYLSDAYLNVDYQEYTSYNFLSYAFFIESYVGGAHPAHDVFTIVFNQETNNIIDITTLIKYNSKTLNVFSNYSRFNLMYDNKVVDINMLLEGTIPIINNFKNFVFSDNIIIFFEEYQIAPYSSGIISLDIPYYMIK